MQSLGALLLSFIKVGCIGFGGGSALIPVIEEEAVCRKGYISAEQYENLVVTANLSPGALPVKLAAGVGSHAAGLAGMCVAASAVSLPAVLATVLLFSLLLILPAGFLQGVENAAVGISVLIIYLLINYICKVQREQRQAGRARASLLLMLVSFILTGGGELRKIFSLPGQPLFDISSPNLMFLAFFLIFLSCAVHMRWLLALGIPTTLLYLLSCGKMQLFSSAFLMGLRLFMVFVMIYSFQHNLQGQTASRSVSSKDLLQKLAIWLAFLLLLSLPSLLIFPNSLEYLGRGLLSTVCSFGGGEAYLTVADGFFIHSGMIDAQSFYNQLVPLANALPGPILCKVLSGVGYLVAFTPGQGAAAWAAALCGYAASVSASCFVFVLIHYFYRKYNHLTIFMRVKQWILPLICGLLLSTMTAMLHENLATAAARGWSLPVALALMALIYGLIILLRRHFKSDLLSIILAASISSLAFSLLTI